MPGADPFRGLNHFFLFFAYVCPFSGGGQSQNFSIFSSYFGLEAPNGVWTRQTGLQHLRVRRKSSSISDCRAKFFLEPLPFLEHAEALAGIASCLIRLKEGHLKGGHRRMGFRSEDFACKVNLQCPVLPVLCFFTCPCLILSNEVPCLFWCFLCCFQGFCGLVMGRQSLVNSRFSLAKTQKSRKGRTRCSSKGDSTGKKPSRQHRALALENAVLRCLG